MSVRVATFNTRHGAREDDHVDHRSLVQTCVELEADILGLQEVESRHRRTWFRNQAALVARRLGCEFVYGTVIRSGLGRYGNALLARGQIRDVEIVTLARPSQRQPRGAILARVELPTLEVTVAVTHLQHQPPHLRHLPAEAPMQLRGLLDRLAARPSPRILLGDLNLGAPSAVPILADAGFATVATSPTFPASAPRVTLDYVAVDGLRLLESHVAPTRVSDHRAVVASVELP